MGSSNNIWGSVAMIALAIVATVATAGWAAAGGWSLVAATAARVAIVMVGGLIISSALAASQPKGPDASQVYSWSPQTRQQPGPMPKAYGLNRLYGTIIGCYTEEVNTWDSYPLISKSEQRLNLLIDYGEGPIAGLVGDSVLINGQPASYWTNVTTEFRRGLLDQTACSKFATELPVEIPVGIPVTYADGARTYTTPDANFDTLAVILEFPEGIYHREKNGDFHHQDIGVKIELAVASSGSWSTLVNTTVPGKTIYPVRCTYRSDTSYAGGSPVTITRGQQYDIRVTKTTIDYTGEAAARFGDDVKIYAVQEIIGVGFTYPGRVLLQVAALATKELSGALNISLECQGAIVNTDMTGGTTLAYSSNPAHILFDMLTMPVISGDGSGTAYAIEEYRGPCLATDPIISTFASLQSYAAALVTDGAGGTEARLTFDGFFDTENTVGDSLTEVLAVCRSHLCWRGNRPYIQIDASRSPVALLCDGNGRRLGRETLIATDERASEIEVHYRDALLDYQRTPLLVRSPTVTNNHKIMLQVNGVVKRSRAARLMNFELKRNEYVTRQLRRTMQFDGSVLEPGDVVYAQRPRRSWGGRLQAVNGRRLRIDREVRRSAADRIIVQVYNPATQQWALESHRVKWITGRDLQISEDWTITPSVDDVYLYGPDAISADLFEVMRLRRTNDHEFTVELMTYDSRLFDADDTAPTFPTDVGITRPQRSGASPVAPATQAQVENANPPGVEAVEDIPTDGVRSIKGNVRFYVDGNSIAHLQRLEAGVWIDLQVWGSASSSSSSTSSSSSSSSSAGA